MQKQSVHSRRTDCFGIKTDLLVQLGSCVLAVMSRRPLRNDEDGDQIRENARKEAGKDDHQKPNEPQERRVNVEIFADAADHAGNDLVVLAAIESFLIRHGA